MRYPKNLQKGGIIGFVAPSFGCATEPYKSAFLNAQKKFKEMGYQCQLGPNCYASEGIGISNTPEKCAAELNKMYLSDEADALISCGGGAALRACNVAEMKKNGRVVLLSASPEVILDRVKDSDDRPVLKGRKSIEGITELMEQRRERYEAAADIVIQTDHKSVQEICEELIQRLSEMDEE